MATPSSATPAQVARSTITPSVSGLSTTLPPAVQCAGLFAFLFSWSDFLFALTLTTGTNLTPVTLGIYSYLGGEIQSWGPVMATGVLSALPAIVLLAFAQRFIAVGQLNGAVK